MRHNEDQINRYYIVLDKVTTSKNFILFQNKGCVNLNDSDSLFCLYLSQEHPGSLVVSPSDFR